jgi:hypothetical protein
VRRSPPAVVRRPRVPAAAPATVDPKFGLPTVSGSSP